MNTKGPTICELLMSAKAGIQVGIQPLPVNRAIIVMDYLFPESSRKNADSFFQI